MTQNIANEMLTKSKRNIDIGMKEAYHKMAGKFAVDSQFELVACSW